MAGVTDLPFRLLCRRLGAAMAVSEMLTANPELQDSRKTRLRAEHAGEPEPRSIQIAGADPAMLARAARHNVAHGAQIIDINMGCPAKKVCNRLAGSALLAEPGLVRDILQAVIEAVAVPVTLKIRTGPDPDHRNAVDIARIADDCGIQALAVHGRTRAEAYRGEAEHQTLREVRQVFPRTLLANGDINSAGRAAQVLATTGADGVMIGRGAQGRPWIFREIQHFLDTGEYLPTPAQDEIERHFLDHVQALHGFYGERQGLRIARKHIGWYLAGQPGAESSRRQLMRAQSGAEQLAQIRAHFARLPRAEAA
ncbi:tRNA dihydrouridine synthase DusB [Methylonatrum kenyense]|nr:tRNA dihydrouridine synthase DusB [Methylonatrum kenyense]